MKLRRTLFLSCLVLAFAALSPVAAQGVTRSPAAGHEVSFLGIVKGVETSTPIDTTHLSVTRESTGIATHLGRFTTEEHFVVDLANLTASGTAVFSAANGGALIGDTSGVATPIPGTPNLFLREVVTITGGTGRFAGATGSFTVKRFLDGVTGKSIGYFTGTISLPG